MSLQVNLRAAKYVSGTEEQLIDERFVRRDYDIDHYSTHYLTAGVKTLVQSGLSSIEFVLARITGDDTDVTIFPNNSVQGWEFDSSFLVYSAVGLTSISLQADADTTVKVYLGGS